MGVISMLMRFDPFGEIDRLTRQLANRVHDSAGTMAMDAYRRGDTVFVQFDLPGVDTDSIELTAEQNTVIVRAERDWEPDNQDQVLARERPQGRFVRQLMLGEHLDTEHIEASYEVGVLKLQIPVAPEAHPRRIEIRGTSQNQAIAAGASSSGDGER
jgi:HSP20 family protein